MGAVVMSGQLYKSVRADIKAVDKVERESAVRGLLRAVEELLGIAGSWAPAPS
jgi:hypothetical protein